MAKIIHYRQRCIGCGICYELQPEFWRMSKKDGKATLLKSIRKKEIYILEIDRQHKETSDLVAEACPVNVIKVV
ncbi:MAG: ferredoxin [Bacteroidia bacterium]|nr:ferredoxin [Bacteroidia bacterium]MCZ2277518.1 ferredoxin [Bacteroidia bacterium]